MEDNNNNIKWEVGDVAICINTGRLSHNSAKGLLPPLRLNIEYIVNAIRTCECGSVKLDVGLCDEDARGTVCDCGARARPGTGIHWANAVRFIKKRTNKEVESEIEEAVAQENFELAEKLAKELKP